MKSEHTYNGGGGGYVSVIKDTVEYSCDCYIDANSYDMQDATCDGEEVSWDDACKTWPEDVRQLLEEEAQTMVDEHGLNDYGLRGNS